MPGIDATGKNTIRARQRDPGEFQDKSFRTIVLDKARGIKAVIGRLKGKTTTTTQSILFPKDKFTVAQARKWLKDHDMKSEEIDKLQEAVWTAKFVNDLPDSAFLYIGPGGSKDSEGKTKPRSLRKFPYKDAGGKIDLPHLRNALARIPQSSLSPDIKKSVAAKARAIAKKQNIEVSEEFLDPVNLLWPLTYPAIFETIIAFNNGELHECYDGYLPWDRVSTYGRKLARKLTQISNEKTINDEYDEDGNPTSSFHQSDGRTTTMYKFHDGQVVVVKSRSSGDDEMEWEYSEGGGEEPGMAFSGEEINDELLEAEHPGEVVKSLRKKKKMSRNDMAAVMNMTASRLKEIEDGDDADDDEVEDMAKALGMSKKKMRKMMAIAIPPDGELTSGTEEIEIKDDDEEIEIEDDDEIIAVLDNVEKKTNGETTFVDKEEKNNGASFVFESVGLYEIDGRKTESHRLCGNIVLEETRKDGTARFKVPIIKINEYTANGNKYSQLCADELIRDVNRLHESQRDFSDDRRTSLDIRIPPKVAESLMEETFDMMPTHGPRVSPAYGNPLTSKAGKIVGAYVEQGSKTVYVAGETIRTQAGKDMSVLIEEGMVKGVSLVGIPKVYESNGKGPNKKGLDVDRLQFLGGDFTDNPAMPFPEFADKETFFEIVN